MRLAAAPVPVPVAGAGVNVGLVLVDDELPIEWLMPLPDDGVCEAGAVLVGVGDLLGEAFVVVFVACGVGLLMLVLGAVSEPGGSALELGHAVEESVGLAEAEALVLDGGSAGTVFVG